MRYRVGRAEPYAWVLPAAAFFALFFVFPLYFGVRLSLSSWSGFTPVDSIDWVGLDNYRKLFGDSVFRTALVNSIVWAVSTTVGFCVIGFILAFALWYQPPRRAGFYRALIFYPTVLSTVITALAWFKIYAIDGLLNSLLGIPLGGSPEIGWLSDLTLVFWAVVWTEIWRSTGFTMILFLAGMTAISPEIIDSAHVDGANSFQIARRIVAPLIQVTIGLAVLINIINGLQVFGPVYVLTAGGPLHSTEMLSTYSYEMAFINSRLGYASAVTMVGVGILLLFAWFRVRAARVV